MTKNESLFATFVRVATELSVESFNSIKMSGATAGNPYQAVDSLARLLVQIFKNGLSESSFDERIQMELANSALSVVALVLIHMQELNPNDFDQKPFLRLFSSVLNDLKPLEIEHASLYRGLLSLIGEVFHSLRPAAVPSFSFSWIQLVSHRNFLSSFLLADGQKVFVILLLHF